MKLSDKVPEPDFAKGVSLAKNPSWSFTIELLLENTINYRFPLMEMPMAHQRSTAEPTKERRGIVLYVFFWVKRAITNFHCSPD